MKIPLRFTTLICLLLGGACILGARVFAQGQGNGSLRGVVADQTGAFIPNATITLTRNDTNWIQNTHSDAASAFNFESVPAGNYQLQVDAAGFRSTLVKTVAVTAGQTTSLTVELELASTSETIQVYGTAGELEPFVSKVVNVGPLGDVDEVDVPYSVNTIPGNVLESQHVTTLADLVKYIPSAQFEQRFGMNIGRLMTRGFQASVFQNVLVDGMYLSSTTQFPLQAYERVEVMNGLGGGIYGPANPSGTFNFILKRPTDVRVETIGADYDDQGNRTFRGDFGGSLGPNKFFGYRMNFLQGNGTSWVQWSRVRQNVESGAYDLHLPGNTLLEVNYFHSQYFQTGLPGSFAYANSISLPKAPDPSKPGLGQPFAGLQVSTALFLARLKHQFGQNFRLMAGVADQQAPRDMWTASNTITSNAGAYKTNLMSNFNKGTVRTAVLYLNGEQKTGPVDHKLVLGARAYSNLGYGAPSSGIGAPSAGPVTYSGTPTLYAPLVASNVPAIVKASASYKSGTSGQETLIFGDTLAWKKWMASFTGSENWMFSNSNSFNTTTQATTRTSSMVQQRFTPTSSLSFKPKQNMTIYFAHSTSITVGEQAPSTASNYPEQLTPEMSHQYEAGYKAQFGDFETTMALFRIDRPIAYTGSDNIFRLQGEQVNRGLEINARGKATRSLNVSSGLTWLDPRMRKTASAAAEGKQYPGAARATFNLLADYQLTAIHALRELSINGDYHLIGKRASNELNSNWMASVSTVDFGARYSHSFEGTVATARFGVMNATNKFYWASVMPGSQTGAVGSNDTANLGAPRTYNFSLLFTLR